jgi:hypothetical protein
MIRHARSEYLVLRRTIGQRSALRHILFVGGTGIWALSLTAVVAWTTAPFAYLIPLLTLVATFEAIRPLHFGAERIGRYLQVFYEEIGEAQRPLRDTPSWERVAMQFGTVPGVGGHPLFLPVFVLMIAVNYIASLYSWPAPVDHLLLALPHALFGGWAWSAHRAMKKQRAIELERMRQLLGK